jgi:hypothetical protein
MNQQEQWQVAGSAPEVYERELVPAVFEVWAPILVEIAQPLRPILRNLMRCQMRSQQLLSTEWKPHRSRERHSIDRELLPAFLKDRSNG